MARLIKSPIPHYPAGMGLYPKRGIFTKEAAMRGYINAHPKVLRARARELIQRILDVPKSEKAQARAKLSDIVLAISHARAGQVTIVPASWDDNQHELWNVLSDYHGVTGLVL